MQAEQTGQAAAAGSIALVGFGEAARAFSAGWDRQAAPAISAYDIQTEDPDSAEAMRDAMRAHAVTAATSPGEALRDARLVFSLVTADQAVAAATQSASHLEPDTLWLDCNSCAPHTKQAAAAIIEAAGAHYIDVAVMAPVHPRRHQTPLLIAGAEADRALERLQTLDMKATIAGAEIGRASTIKLMRSIMIKGLEALTAECLLAARRAGVDDDVLASLQASDPNWDWTARSHYNLERMVSHGKRRSAEMAEAAAMLRELGCADRLAMATTDWQADLGRLDIGEQTAALETLDARSDLILSRLD